MAKVSFESVDSKPVTATLAVQPTETLVVAPTLNDSALVGEWTTQDTRLPRISLVNKSGELGNTYPPGTFVINKEHQLNSLAEAGRGAPVKVIAARMLKQYRENTPFDPENPSRIFDLSSEVRGVGGTVSREKGSGFFSEMAHIEFFVEQPENLSDEASSLFCTDIDGKNYARVLYTAAGTAFGAVAVILASSIRGHLSSAGLCGGAWDLGSELKKGTNMSWWQPTLRSAGLVSKATRDHIAALA
jgi:hypothetical protein